MVNTFIFLRHAQTAIDLTRPAREWSLSEIGIKQSQNLAASKFFSKIDVIYCSTEKKTHLTAQNLAILLNKPIQEDVRLDETGSGELPITDVQKFEKQRYECFMNLDSLEFGQESFRKALSRFKSGIADINDQYKDKIILIVSHGTVLSLFFADLLGILDDGSLIFKRWKQLKFCAWGLVSNSNILKDINKI